MKTKQLTPAAKAVVEEFAAVRADLKLLEIRQENLREKILLYTDHLECALRFNGDLLCTVEEKPGRNKCDTKLLKAQYPDVAAAVMTIGLPFLQIETKITA
jgi:hypothetical protein